MFLFDMCEEGSVAEVTLAAGTDEESLFLIVRFLFEHRYIQFY